MTNFRLCPDTGLYFDKQAESLMKVNAVAAAVFLLVAGILALGVALTRWPAVHLLPAGGWTTGIFWSVSVRTVYWSIMAWTLAPYWAGVVW